MNSQARTSPKAALQTYEQSERHCSVFVVVVEKAFVYHELKMFKIKVSIKDRSLSELLLRES